MADVTICDRCGDHIQMGQAIRVVEPWRPSSRDEGDCAIAAERRTDFCCLVCVGEWAMMEAASGG